MLLRPIALDESIIGQPLPWDLYTGGGVLVIAGGTIIETPEQLRKLLVRPLFRKPHEAPEGLNPAERMPALMAELERLGRIPPDENLDDGVRALARELINLAQFDADATLGLARLLPMASQALRHCLMCAILCHQLGLEIGVEEIGLENLVCAALTMNFAALALHEAVARGHTQYTDDERRQIRSHPKASADLLHKRGVDSPDWLNAVRQHHEHMDGSGYPEGLIGVQINLLARIIRVADYFCAKIVGRGYRPPRTPRFAFQEIFGKEHGRLDSQIAVILLRLVSPLPPGTLVRLASRETAVIARLNGKGGIASAVSVLDSKGRTSLGPMERDITTKKHAPRGIAEQQYNWPPIEWGQVWGY